MRRAALLLAIPLALLGGQAAARTVVDASAPSALAVTVYRDPGRGIADVMDPNWPQGFAMISETRQVTLPPGESTIRFTGVAEGMVAVSAIVTGLPGGTIEKNRNADLISPGALVDGTLGNRVYITRTNPGTGAAVTEDAFVRSRADGGLVLQTRAGYEAVRCSGLPEKLGFDRVPQGLSAQPVYSIDTADSGGTYTVRLTYLAWGFDWQASYVATLDDPDRGRRGEAGMQLMSWLTVLNSNRQTFGNADLMAVAGTLNVQSDYQQLADPPQARPLYLQCYPIGSSAAGSSGDGATGEIVVTGMRVSRDLMVPPPPPPSPPLMAMAADAFAKAEVAMMAGEEDLGALKLYRVPEKVDVSAQSLKQVAFMNRDGVEGRLVYDASCFPARNDGAPRPADLTYATVNDRKHGLDLALPSGGIVFFEPTQFGELVVAQQTIRDFARGQNVEIGIGTSSQVSVRCERVRGWAENGEAGDGQPRGRMRATLTNANPAAVPVRLRLGSPLTVRVTGLRSAVLDGQLTHELRVPGNGRVSLEWDVTGLTD